MPFHEGPSLTMSQKPQPLLIVASFPYFIIPSNQPNTIITDGFHDCFLSLLIFELSKSPLPLADLQVPEICPCLCSEGQEQRESYQLAFLIILEWIKEQIYSFECVLYEPIGMGWLCWFIKQETYSLDSCPFLEWAKSLDISEFCWLIRQMWGVSSPETRYSLNANAFPYVCFCVLTLSFWAFLTYLPTGKITSVILWEIRADM